MRRRGGRLSWEGGQDDPHTSRLEALPGRCCALPPRGGTARQRRRGGIGAGRGWGGMVG